MPELPEVHRATHFLKRYLVQPGPHTLSLVSYCTPKDGKNPATATNDPKIFETAKTGVDVSTFSTKLQGKRIKDVGRLGKYFWLEMESPPHPLFHFGMTGWIKYKGSKGENVHYWEGKTEGRKDPEKALNDESTENGPQKVPEEEWPPKFAKVLFEATSEQGEVTTFAFVDGRRFGRIFLVHPPKGKTIRETEPLSLNGPDPVLEADQITPAWFTEQVAKRKVPIKAYLLDQHNLSGVGNWVADEVLFHAGIHPETNANALGDAQIERLGEQLKTVCKTAAVDALGDSEKFPSDWLMRHRWRLDKTGNAGVLPSGEKIVRITVGGRSSAVVPSRQARGSGGTESKGSKKRKLSPTAKIDADDERDAADVPAARGRRSKRNSSQTGELRASDASPAVPQTGPDVQSQSATAGKNKARGRRR